MGCKGAWSKSRNFQEKLTGNIFLGQKTVDTIQQKWNKMKMVPWTTNFSYYSLLYELGRINTWFIWTSNCLKMDWFKFFISIILKNEAWSHILIYSVIYSVYFYYINFMFLITKIENSHDIKSIISIISNGNFFGKDDIIDATNLFLFCVILIITTHFFTT